MKITIGIHVDGYTEYKITDTALLETKASHVMVYLDRESNDRLIDYYKAVRELLRYGTNKVVILANKDDESNIVQAITHLCLEYGCYNIYYIVNGISVTSTYVDDLFNRESSLDEVQMFIGAKDAAYESVTMAMLKITEYTLDNKIDELQDYIIQNKDLIRQYPAVIDYMKQNIDEINYGIGVKVKELESELERIKADKKELEESRNSIHASLMDAQSVVRQREADNEEISRKLKSYQVSIDKLQKEKTALEEDKRSLEAAATSGGSKGGSVFQNYAPMRLTEQKGNKVKIVLYIKEVSRPKYINTFMMQLFSFLNERHTVTRGKVKMIIYDTRQDFGILYHPLLQVNTDTYFEQKSNVMNSPIVVFTDTNPTYMRELPIYSKAEYFIVYDRLGKATDILMGESVIKFYAFASKRDLVNFKQKYSELDESRVIMNPSGVLNTLEISELSGFRGDSAAPAKFAKYFKMQANKNSAATLFSAIISKCGLPDK